MYVIQCMIMLLPQMSKCAIVEYWKYHLHKITGNSIWLKCKADNRNNAKYIEKMFWRGY